MLGNVSFLRHMTIMSLLPCFFPSFGNRHRRKWNSLFCRCCFLCLKVKPAVSSALFLFSGLDFKGKPHYQVDLKVMLHLYTKISVLICRNLIAVLPFCGIALLSCPRNYLLFKRQQNTLGCVCSFGQKYKRTTLFTCDYLAQYRLAKWRCGTRIYKWPRIWKGNYHESWRLKSGPSDFNWVRASDYSATLGTYYIRQIVALSLKLWVIEVRILREKFFVL